VAPFLITLEIEIGSLLLTGEHAAFDLERARATGIAGFFQQAAAGSVFVGGALALLGGLLAFVLARPVLRKSPDDIRDEAIRRTIDRYRGARLADRMYVAGKLQQDPILGEISALDGDFGRVLDAGAGRGQLGLSLLELGRVTRLSGFDSDPRKVALAQAAGQGQAHYEVGDLAGFEWPASDSVLLIDVLHYLPIDEQDAVLGRAAASVPIGGRVVVREVDAALGVRSGVTRATEWFTTTIGLNRARSRLEYRSAREIVDRLESLGCSCEVRSASKGTPFANVLIVATRIQPELPRDPGADHVPEPTE
jgi:SAM-dependent methyltransferase